MIRLPPRSTRTDTLFPYTTLFRSCRAYALSCGLDAGPTFNVVSDSSVIPEASLHGTPGRTYAWLKIDNSLSTRSEEHTSELQSLMRISYAVFCLKKKNNKQE